MKVHKVFIKLYIFINCKIYNLKYNSYLYYKLIELYMNYIPSEIRKWLQLNFHDNLDFVYYNKNYFVL